jgi:hypothetical protein
MTIEIRRRLRDRRARTGVALLTLLLTLSACHGESYLEEAKKKCDAHGGVFRVVGSDPGHRIVECNEVRRDLPGTRWSFAVREPDDD